MLIDKIEKTIEALFFIKGDEGIHVDYFSTFMDIEKNEAENLLNIFKENYNKKDGALIVKKFGSNYKMLVKEEIYTDIKEKLSEKKLTKLSKAAMETLAIIAYNQPISKLEIDKIRGVNSDGIIATLMDKELIFSDKFLDKIGKPKLYETTDLFLDLFGIETLEQLPKIENTQSDNDLESLDEFLDK